MTEIKKFKVINSETILDKFFKIKKDKIKLPDGNMMDYYSVNTKDVISIIAINEKNEVLICRQYRHPTGKVIDDFPAGWIEKGESPEAAAKRELEEETGYTAKELKKLGNYYPTPGVSNTKIHFFLATGIKKDKEQNLDPSEFIEVKLIPLEKLTKKILESKHKDLPSSFGILLYHKMGGNSNESKTIFNRN